MEARMDTETGDEFSRRLLKRMSEQWVVINAHWNSQQLYI